MGGMDTCSRCGSQFTRLDWQIKSYDRRCPECHHNKGVAYRARRAADGNPVIGGRGTPETRKEWRARYLSKPDVKARRVAWMKERRNDPEYQRKNAARRLAPLIVRANINLPP